MEDIKEKIQKIKLSRMGPEYRFVNNFFNNLEPHVSKAQPGKVFFLKDDVPIFQYMMDGNYFWCHYEIVWSPLQDIVNKVLRFNTIPTYQLEFIEMRKIISHFALAYLNLTDLTISMASSSVTNSWKILKFKHKYVW